MKGIKVLLFGISVVLFAGFSMSLHRGFFWVMLLGLVVSFVGLLTDDSGEQEEASSSDGPDDGGGPRDEDGPHDGDGPAERDGPSDEGVADDGDSEGEFEQDPRYLPPSRFPPM